MALAEQEYRNGNITTSSSYYKKAGELYKQIKQFEKWVDCEYDRAYNAIDMGDYENARKIAEQALSAHVTQPCLDFTSLAKLNKILGVVERKTGDCNKAMHYFNSALKSIGPQNNNAFTGGLYNDLGTAYHCAGRREEALRNYIKANKIVENDNPLKPHIMNNIAVTYNEIGDYEHALQILRSAYEMEENSPTVNSGNILNNIAVCYLKLGDVDRALEYFEKTVELFVQMEVSYSDILAYAYNNIGVLYNERKEFDRAWSYFNKSYAIYEEIHPANHPNFAGYYNNLAARFRYEKNYVEALRLYEKSLTIAKVNDDDGQILKALNNIALVQFEQGKLKEALRVADLALLIFKTQQVTPEEMAITRELRALIYFKNGNQHRALEEVNASIGVLVKDYNPKETEDLPGINIFNYNLLLIDLLTEKAAFLKSGAVSIDQLKTSLATYDLAIHVQDKLRGLALGDESKLKILDDAKEMFKASIDLCVVLYERTRDEDYVDKAFSYAEKSRTILIRYYLGQQSVLKSLQREASVLVTREARLNGLKNYYVQQLLENDTTNRINEGFLRKRIFEVNEAHDSVMVSLAKKYPAFYKLKYENETVSIGKLRQTLIKGDNAIIRFFATDEKLYTFLMTSTNEKILVCNDVKAVDRMIENTIIGIKTKNQSLYKDNALALYTTLIAPLALQGDIKKLVVIPDGKLFYLPFDVLLTEHSNEGYRNLPYLLRRFSVHYQVSTTLMFDNEGKSLPIGKKIVAFAPVNAPKDFNLPDLYHSEKEVENTVQVMNGRSFVRETATETAFKNEAYDCSVIHLAMHAITDDVSPLRSKLLFSTAKDSINDGVLYSYEVYNMKIPASLVALSGCNTGVGKLENGEGVMSLARSFFFAGTSSILMSLWPSSDNATATIMNSFYQELANGVSKDDALRQAKLDYLNSSDELSADPFLWSSFVLIGQANPFIYEEYIYEKWVAAVAMLIAIVGCYFLLRKKNRNQK